MEIIRNDVREEEVFREFYESDSYGRQQGVSYETFRHGVPRSDGKPAYSRKGLIDGPPLKREWKEVSFETVDYSRLRVMTGSPPWNSIQSGTLPDTLKILMESQEQEWKRRLDKVNTICQGGTIDPRGILLITDTHASSPLTIIEGHHRLLALFWQNKPIERCYVGICEGDSIWMRKKGIVLKHIA